VSRSLPAASKSVLQHDCLRKFGSRVDNFMNLGCVKDNSPRQGSDDVHVAMTMLIVFSIDFRMLVDGFDSSSVIARWYGSSANQDPG
jgi:hypothetical protein